jgi:Uma2 family endonuclease
MTVAEYDQIPNPPGGVYELYHGQLVKVEFRRAPQLKAQRQIRRMLEVAIGEEAVVVDSMPFRPLPEYECGAADVAIASHARWKTNDDWLMGAPELVVEIRSPSNSLPKLLEKARMCLANGAFQFWIVDLRRREVKVLTLQREAVYGPGQRIPLYFDGEIQVDEIFR